MLHRLKFFAVVLASFVATNANAIGWFGMTLDGQRCQGGSQSFGPWDFFDVDEESDPSYVDGRWWEAKNVHGKPGLTALYETPMTQVTYNKAADEFDYLLRAYPNHPEILSARIELEIRRSRAERRIAKHRTPPECYLRRAAMFRPKQPHVRQLMGYYMHRLGRYEDAVTYYQEALELDENLSEVHYNLGLVFVSLGDFDAALKSAHAAYALGFPLPGLKRRLVRERRWRPLPPPEPTPEPEPEVASSDDAAGQGTEVATASED